MSEIGGTRPLPVPSKDLSFLVGAGSLWATAHDLFDVTCRVSEGGYGAADAGARAADGSIHWMGFGNGFSANVDYDPTTDVTIVITSNLLTGAAEWIRRDVPRILMDEPLTTPRLPVPAFVELSDDRRRHLEGVYDSFGTHQALTFVDEKTAVLGGEYLLLATSDSSFFAPQHYSEFRAVTDSTGSVRALELLGPNPVSIERVR